MRSTALVLLAGSLMLAQTPKPAFEVVSIKSTSETPVALFSAGKELIKVDNAQAMYRAINLLGLVQLAYGQSKYGLQDDQVQGPSWMADVRFDVTAKLPVGATKDQVPAMLWSMLADRFKMTAHEEERVRPVFFLVVGKGRLKLQETAGGDRTTCNGGRGGHHVCQNITMERFAEFLSMGRRLATAFPVVDTPVWLDRPVIDHTGLKGAYDFTMDFGQVGGTGDRRAVDPATLVPIKDAVKDLGLALESGKAPYHVLVIDHIERVPTEN